MAILLILRLIAYSLWLIAPPLITALLPTAPTLHTQAGS